MAQLLFAPIPNPATIVAIPIKPTNEYAIRNQRSGVKNLTTDEPTKYKMNAPSVRTKY